LDAVLGCINLYVDSRLEKTCSEEVILKNVSKITIMRKSIFKLFVCVAALWMFSTHNASAQMVAVRTDAVKDLLVIPNVGLDLVVGEKYTLGAELAYKPDVLFGGWMTSVTPEFRYWFSGRPLTRQYVGVVANMTAYGFRPIKNPTMHRGDAFGVGLSFGHVWTLTQRWNIDFTGSLGLVAYRGLYGVNEPKNHGISEYGYTLLPIRLGVSVVYVIR
jgi:hypothetical protein